MSAKPSCLSFLHPATCLIPVLLLTLLLLPSPSPAAEPNPQRQQQYLEESLALFSKNKGRYPMTTRLDRTWHDWQQRTGEVPSDFALMKSQPLLPDPLILEVNGTKTTITTDEQWEAKRTQVQELFQHYISGTVPPPPGNVEATILEDRADGDTRVQLIELRFGPDPKATLTVELLLPPGPGPHPVYMTQWNHRDWAQLALRRGYIGCVYAAADLKDDTEPYAHLYPDYDFTQLMRRAWGASRVVDYLHTRTEVNKQQIAITGHSRNGKQSLWAAAFDERISAVISSSCFTGGVMPWRYTDPQYADESLETIVGIANAWFQPRLRYFFGREDFLPIDQNLLLSIIAPRPLLMHYSYMEKAANPWAVEQCYHSVRKAYAFRDASNNLSIFQRPGEHAVAARDVERCIDFLDNRFRRNNVLWQTDLLFDYSYDDWLASHQADLTSATRFSPTHLTTSTSLAQQLPEIREKLNWLLGETPSGVQPTRTAPTAPSRIDWMDLITSRPQLKRAKVLNIGPYTALGDHVAASLYYPNDATITTKSGTISQLPAFIFLHNYAYAHGYASGGTRDGTQPIFQQLVDAGYAVLAIDMFGFGTRLQEAQHFYKRHHKWSKMGKMVLDVSACVTALETFDFIDHNRIYLLGDTLGGSVALFAAALDPRIDGVAAVAAFSPWRASNQRYPSIHTFSHLHGFMPRLGLYANNPSETPVDYPEILAAISPRPLHIIAPTLNRHADPAAVADTLTALSPFYDPAKLKFETPREINRTTPAMVKSIIRFFDQQKPE